MKVLVCGCGSIGRRHIRNLVEHFKHEVSAYDPASDCLATVERGFPVKAFDNEDQAFEMKPDVVIAAGPSSTHLETAERAIAANAHVFIEKPIADRPDGIEGLLEKAIRKKLVVAVGSNMRFYPGPRLLKENLSKLGKVYFSKAYVGYYLPYMRPGVDYRNLYVAKKDTGGGLILDDIHEIDYHLWLFGKAENVFCRTAKLGELEIAIEDCAEISLSFSSGVSSQIHMDFLTKCRTRSCEIVGENGILLWEERGKPPKCSVRFYSDADREWHNLLASAVVDTEQCFVEQFEEFFAAAGGGVRKTLADGREGLCALEVALAAEKSAEHERIVEL